MILKNFNLFVDGKGHAGKADEVTLPKLALKTDEIKAGGMDAPVDVEVGMEKLEPSFSIIGSDPATLALWGVSNGANTPLRFKGAQKDNTGKVSAIDVEMRGLIKEVDMGNWKAGEKSIQKFTMNCNYYKFTQDGKVIYEIDILNMIRKINGKDVLAEERKALGI